MPTLTWLTRKESMTQTARAPYRALVGLPALDYGRLPTDNLLIQGDNLHALKALCPYFAGQVKCIFIDPPYNTRQDFDHYQDNLQHTQWLEMMYPRLTLLNELLAEDGFFCCQIDDHQSAYLKVLMDEVFGRKHYQTTFYIQVRYASKTLKSDMDYHKQIEQIHIYRKGAVGQPFLIETEQSFDKFQYQVIEKEKGKIIDLGGKKVEVFSSNQYKIERVESSALGLKEIWATGTILDGNSSGRFFRDYLTGRAITDGLGCLYKVCGIGDDGLNYRYFTGPKRKNASKGKYYQGVPVNKKDGQPVFNPIPNYYDMSGNFGNCRLEGGVDFRSGKKPEILLKTIFDRFTKPGDLVLDSFLGSGTAAAVAHKMGRRWIGIEMGEQAETHCARRLRSVIDGEQSGISAVANWQGGGGFHFLRLGGAVFTDDGDISPAIKFPELAAYIWFAETRAPLPQKKRQNPFLGIHNGIGYALLYNGILGDKTINGGNVLIMSTLAHIRQGAKKHKGKIIVYGESCRLGENRLKLENIEFRQLPYECKKR